VCNGTTDKNREDKNLILTMFNAFSGSTLREAFKEWAFAERDKRRDLGWKLVEYDSEVSEDHDWTIINGKKYIKPRTVFTEEQLAARELERVKFEEKRRLRVRAGTPRSVGVNEETLKCPFCSGNMYSYGVCKNCAKGKAGLKYQWICGEDSSHVFYTE